MACGAELVTTLPEELAEALQRVRRGDLSFRLPRTNSPSVEDAVAYYFNCIADELERTLQQSQQQEERLARSVERFSDALIHLAAGNFSVEVERDFHGDGIDALASLVNHVAGELRVLVAEKERTAREREAGLASLVDERTARLRESEESFRRLFEAAPVPMVLIDVEDGTVRAANERAVSILAVPQAELVGAEVSQFFEDEGERRQLMGQLGKDGTLDAVTTRLRPKSGSALWSLVSARQLSLDKSRMVIVSFQDITQQKRIEDALRDLATKDSLTGVLNRRRFFELSEEEFARVDRYGGDVVIAVLDLDRFKVVNDRFGHVVGDEALREVAQATVRATRRQDHVGRYGGEEFILLMPETNRTGASAIAERVRASIAAIELCHQGVRVGLTASIGVAARQPQETVLSVTGRADEALYRAKAAGRNRVQVA